MEAKFVGQTRQEVINRAYANAIDNAKTVVTNYVSHVDEIINAESKKTFKDYALLPFGVQYSVAKGLFGGLVDTVTGLVQTGIIFANDLQNLGKAMFTGNFGEELDYTVRNLLANGFEGMYSSVVSTIANIGGTFGADTDWAFGKQGEIANTAKVMNRFRVKGWETDSLFGKQPSLFEQNKLWLENNDEENRAFIDSKYNDWSKNWLKGTANVNKWVQKNVVESVVNAQSYGLGKAGVEAWEDNPNMNMAFSTSESIGNILSMWLATKLAKQANIPNAEAVGSAYFASSIFGRNMSEALNNGASINDAYTYALGSAILETGVESIMGFTPAGTKATKLSDLTTKIMNSKWGGVIANAVEEGFEEVISAYAGTGLEYYSTGERRIEQRTPEEFRAEVFYSFLGGAVSSLGLGAGRNMYLDTTLEGKANKFVDTLKQNVNERSIQKLGERLNVVVEELNKTNTQGVKQNVNGETYIGQLTLAEKKDFLANTDFGNFIELTDQGFQVKDKFKNMNVDSLRNRIVKPDGTIEYVNDGVYATTNMAGVLNDNAVKIENLNDNGKRVWDIFQNSKLIIEVIHDNDIESYGHFDNKSGVIYINENSKFISNLSDDSLKAFVASHEETHRLKSENPKDYAKLSKILDSFVTLKYGEETGLEINIKNETIKNHLEKSGYYDNIKNSFVYYATDGGMTNAEALDATMEELMAYFNEEIIRNQNFLDSVASGENLSLREQLRDSFFTDENLKSIAGDDKSLYRELKSYQKKYIRSVNRSIKHTQTIAYVVDNLMGGSFIDYFDQKIIDKHGFELVFKAVVDALENGLKEIKLGDDVYKFEEVFKDNRLKLHKRLTEPKQDVILGGFVWEDNKRPFYTKTLYNFIKDYYYMLDMVDRDLYSDAEALRDKVFRKPEVVLNDKDKETFARVVSFVEYIKQYDEYKLKKNLESYENTFAETRKAIRTFVSFMNRNYANNYGKFYDRASAPFGVSSARSFINADPNVSSEALKVSALFFEEDMRNIIESNPNYRGKYEVKVERVYKNKKPIGLEINVIPNDDYIADRVQARIEKQELEDLAPDKDSTLPITLNSDLSNRFVSVSNEIVDEKSVSFVSTGASNAIKLETLNPSVAKMFSLDNVVVETFLKYDEEVTEAINNGFNIAPVVMVIVPSIYNSYAYQKDIDNDAKMIYQENLGNEVGIDQNGNETNVNLILQVWVEKTSIKYREFDDIRLNAPQKRQSEDFRSIALNSEKQRFDDLKDGEFDFAVLSRGSKNTDFNAKFYKKSEMEFSKKYIAIKAPNELTLSILENLDYNRIADLGTSVRRGFTIRDVIEEYNRIKNNEPDKNRRYKRTTTKDLTTYEKQQIEEFFKFANVKDNFNSFVSQFFVISNGKYVLKNRNIMSTIKGKELKINNTTFNTNDGYAFNVHHTFDFQTKMSEPEYKPIAYNNLQDQEKLLFNFLASTKISFVFYRADDSRWGYSLNDKQQSVIFLNTFNGITEQHVLETFLHEGMHETFKFVPDLSIKLTELFGKMFFDSNGEPTDLWWEFNKAFAKLNNRANDKNVFLNYLSKGYKEFATITTPEKLYNKFFKNPSTTANTLYVRENELITQMVGIVFSDQTLFGKVLKADGNSSFVFQDFFSKMLNNPNIDATTKNILRTTSERLLSIFDAYFDKLKELFKPLESSRIYTLKELNAFIKSFSDGLFTTRSGLTKAYLEEQANNKPGIATTTISNIIYIASKYAPTVTQGVNAYQTILNMFKHYKDIISLFLEESSKVVVLNNAVKNYKKIENELKKINRLLKKGEDVDAGKILSILKVLKDEYNKIDKSFFPVLGLPNIDDFNIAIDLVINVIEKKVKVFTNSNFNSMTALLAIQEFFKNFNAIDFVKNNPDFADAEIKKIIAVQAKVYDLEMDKFYNSYNSSTESTIAKIESTGHQAKTQATPQLLEATTIIREIGNIIKTYRNDLIVMKSEIVSQLDKLRNLALQKNMDGEYIWFDSDIIPMIENLFDSVYYQMSIFFKDESIYSTYKQVHFILPVNAKFSQNAFNSSLTKILLQFQTDYKTSLSSQGENYDNYAIRQQNEITEFTKSRDKEQVVAKVMKASKIMKPQDVFAMWREITEGKISFFVDFEREYDIATRRRAKIMADYLKRYDEWHKANPTIVKHSLTKTDDIDMQMFVNIRPEAVDRIKKEIQNEEKAVYENLQVLRDKKSENAIKIMNVKNAILLYNAQIKNAKTPTGDKTLLKDLEAKKKKKQLELKTLENERDRLKFEITLARDSVDNFPYDLRVKQRIIEELQETPLTTKQISRGTLVSLYMSVMREIEMKELFEKGDANIKPTEHFRQFGGFYEFDNELMNRKNYEIANNEAEHFVIMIEDKQELANYLLNMMTQEDFEMIDFMKEMADFVYERADEIYFKRYQVHLPRQAWYIHFASKQSNYEREFHFKSVKRKNIAPEDSFVTETTLGAGTALRIENIFSVIMNMVNTTANYQYENIVKDYQNLLVNRTAGSTFESAFDGAKNIFGRNNNVISRYNDALVDVLKYRDIDRSLAKKLAYSALRNAVVARIAFAVPIAIKQLLSVFTISIKNKINVANLTKNVGKNLFRNSKYRRWLMENMPEIYLRSKTGGSPSLSEQTSVQVYQKLGRGVRSAVDKLAWHINWIDGTVLVGTFETIVNSIQKRNLNLSESEVFEKASIKLLEVLKYGVASTDSAYRSSFENSDNLFEKYAGKFMSENVLQTSGIMRALFLVQNKISGSWEKLFQAIMSFFLSALGSAFVSTGFNYARGYLDEDDPLFDMLVNDLIWGNMVGSIPYINLVANLVKFDKKTIIKPGYDAQIPLLSEIQDIIEILSSMSNGKNVGGKAVKALGFIGSLFGVPVQNSTRMVRTISKLFGDSGNQTALEVNAFLTMQTETQMFNKAVKAGKANVVENYVNAKFDNLAVQAEIARLLTNKPATVLNMRMEKTFTKKDVTTGKMVKYNVPNNVYVEYKNLTQKALQYLIRLGDYKKLSDDEKIKAMQRVINYYYNHMKLSILGEKNAMNSVLEVGDRAIRYAN